MEHIITPIPIVYTTTPINTTPFIPTLTGHCVISPVQIPTRLVCPGAPIKIRHIKNREGYLLTPRRLF